MGVADYLFGSKGFKDLNQTHIDAFNSICTEESFIVGDTIFPEESPRDKMFITKTGSVKILKKVKDKENTLAVLNPREFFGEMALLDGLPRSAAAKVNADTSVITIYNGQLYDTSSEISPNCIKDC